MTVHHSSRMANERRKDRERQRRRRANMRAGKVPSTHTVNRAIVEAFAFCLDQNHQPGTKRRATTVTWKEVLEAAVKVLTYGGQYDLEASIVAVAKKTKPTCGGFWRINGQIDAFEQSEL